MLNQLIHSFQYLRRFDGPPEKFWPQFLEAAAGFCAAECAILLGGGPSEGNWQPLFVWPQNYEGTSDLSALTQRGQVLAQRGLEKGQLSEAGLVLPEKGQAVTLVGIKLDATSEGGVYVALLALPGPAKGNVQEALLRLNLISDVPATYYYLQDARHGQVKAELLNKALDILLLLQEKDRYIEACMTVCNEVTAQYSCTRVSIGWLKGSSVRLQAMSHMERFEKKMDAVRSLEAAMEESMDQDEEITWPPQEDSDAVNLAHETFARRFGADYLLSLPLRVGEEPVGIICCERQERCFTEEDVLGLRLVADQIAKPLDQLQRQDRWFGAKAAAGLKKGLQKITGPEHTLAKVISVLISIILVLIIFGTWEYKVEAPFLLKTDKIAYLPAPYDGYVDKVHVQVGEQVDKGETLLALDTRELELQSAQALANKHRYLRESEKARAKNELASMKIARARVKQAEARLESIHYRLEHARVQAPFSGIVVEGEDEELLGSPVRKGDVLFKVARIEDMYAELAVKERSIHELSKGDSGEIAFVSRPDLKFAIRVKRINPISEVREEDNRFLVRAEIADRPAKWWRPGMSGISKIDAGKRSILWILTHRTVDFLRMFFWI